jgi:hypothetical protein
MSEDGGGKVFGIGLSKTGTTSLYAALHFLGFRSGTFGHLRQLRLHDWFKGDFSKDYLHKYDAMTDLPIGTFFRELDQRYPASKFILTVRDVDQWLQSCGRLFSHPPRDSFVEQVRMRTYGMLSYDVHRFRMVYQNHVKSVTRHFSERKTSLLVLDIAGGEGWNELCQFLHRDKPDRLFPHVQPSFRVPGDIEGPPDTDP